MEPTHCVRFGRQVDVQGVLAGTPQAEKTIGYLVKYLMKDLGDDLDHPDDTREDNDSAGSGDGGMSEGPATETAPDSADRSGSGRARRRGRAPEERATAARRADHRARLVDALRYEPCSPRCANWLRYGIQPKHPRPGLVPGACKGKAHRPSHLGYGGRRVLASRKWSGKDLADHRHDRKAHVLKVLGRLDELAALERGEHPDGRDGVAWELARPTAPDVPPAQTRLHLAIARAVRQRAAYRTAQAARDRDRKALDDSSATDPAAPAA